MYVSHVVTSFTGKPMAADCPQSVALVQLSEINVFIPLQLDLNIIHE